MSKRAKELAAECTMAVVQAVRNGKDAQAAALEALEQYGREVREAAAMEGRLEIIERTEADYDLAGDIADAIRKMELP